MPYAPSARSAALVPVTGAVIAAATVSIEPLENRMLLSVANGDAVADVAGPPVVTAVFVNGTAWADAFRNFIAASGEGDGTFGYRLNAAKHASELPWVNLNQVSVRFSEHVNVASDDLVVHGVNVKTYAGLTFAYEATTFTATWTLPLGTSFNRDKLLLDLGGDSLGGVTDTTGNALDGEWANPTSPAEGGADAFPSGDGTAGGDFRFRLNVLPGDVNGTGNIFGTDVTLVRNAQGSLPGSGLYTVFKDVNGSGNIFGTDVTLVRNRQGTSLPGGEPSVPTYDVAFSSYLGGSNQEQVRDIVTDAQGNIYVTGGGGSANFPTTAGAFDTTPNGNFDVFVTKYTPGGQVIWSTVLGGSEYDRAYALEVDASGYVYIAGRAGRGLPTTAGAFQPNYNGHYTGTAYGNQNAFVAKLKPDGSGLVFASYFGSYELIRDLAIDASGDIYVAGSRRSTETGTTPPAAWFANAFQKNPNAGGDTVIAKIKSDGSQLLWATYYGGAGSDGTAPSIRVDPLNRPVVVGTTTSLDLATTPGAFDRTHNGGVDMFVAKFSADGSSLVYGTYLGGTGNEYTETHNLVLDAAGNPYVSGYTSSTNFPTTAGALQPKYGGGSFDAFVTRLSADGSTLLASTYYGGSGSEGINLDAAGNVYISGPSTSPNLQMTADVFRANNAGGSDMFVAKLSSNLTTLRYASYLGGPGNDSARTSWVDGAGNIYVAGHVSNGFFTRNAAQPLFGGGVNDNGIAKFVIL